MAIKTYSKGKATQLSTNFKSTEFDCHGNGCCTQTQIDDKFYHGDNLEDYIWNYLERKNELETLDIKLAINTLCQPLHIFSI